MTCEYGHICGLKASYIVEREATLQQWEVTVIKGSYCVMNGCAKKQVTM